MTRSVACAGEYFKNCDDQLIMVDIGSRGGVRPEWHPIKDVGLFIGFEPDEAECEKYNRTSPRIRMFPVALDETSGPKPFFTAESPDCGGFRKTNEAFMRRFPNYINNKITGEVVIETSSFDQWAQKQVHTHYDFIKVDTEGSELRILRGARDSIERKKCLGVLTEVWIEPDVKQGSGYGLAALDDYLRGCGFRMFDIEVSRYPVNALPMGDLIFSRSPSNPNQILADASPLRKVYGRVKTGDLLYFRDPIAEYSSDREACERFWDVDTLFRYLVLLDLYNYRDVALEVLAAFRKKFDQATVARLVEALVPPSVVDNQMLRLSYEEYHRISMELFIKLGGCNDPSLVSKLEVIPAKFD